jgi:hypothetical protein
MTHPTYQTQSVDENIYTFASIGKKGIILKVVIFLKSEIMFIILALEITISRMIRLMIK